MSRSSRYIFGGHAVASEVHIRKPQDHICWIQGAMALPVTGGYGKVEVPGWQCEIPATGKRISFDFASAFVSGDFLNPDDPGSPTRTVTAAHVKGLNVLDRLRVESLSAHLIVDDPRKGQPRLRFGEKNPFDQTEEPKPIVGLSLDGFPIAIEFDDTFRKYSTLQDLQRNTQYKSNYVVASIVKRLSWPDREHPDVKIEGNVLNAGNFARIFVGELLIGKTSRNLTLLRLQFDENGLDNDASGDVGSDPRPWPPIR